MERKFKEKEVSAKETSKLVIKSVDKNPQSKLSEDDYEQIRPSFQEFVSYILDTDFDLTQENVSWTPYHLLCTPCLLKYQIVAKEETIKEDEIYIIRAAGLQNIIKLRGRQALLSRTYSSQISEEAKKHFSQISKLNVHRLFEKYKLDFELFNYNFKEYVNWAQ